jgi:hypothetical protein
MREEEGQERRGWEETDEGRKGGMGREGGGRDEDEKEEKVGEKTCAEGADNKCEGCVK